MLKCYIENPYLNVPIDGPSTCSVTRCVPVGVVRGGGRGDAQALYQLYKNSRVIINYGVFVTFRSYRIYQQLPHLEAK